MPRHVLLVLLAAGAVAAAAADPEGTCLKGDCENGQGTYQSANGDRYAGQWVAGLPSGTGTYSYDDGSVYIGELKAGLFDGQGQATFVTKDRSGHDRYARQNFAIRRALLWIACGAPCPDPYSGVLCGSLAGRPVERQHAARPGRDDVGRRLEVRRRMARRQDKRRGRVALCERRQVRGQSIFAEHFSD